ncbi:MAG: preprotein translocase subunit SecE [Bacilli bacterium]|nr:preprotein translocase subunit SecE [Bacilli bacterium]
MKNIFKAIGRYFKGVKKETSRIRWTSGKDLVKYSLTVVLFMLFLGVYFYGIDLLITLLRSNI